MQSINVTQKEEEKGAEDKSCCTREMSSPQLLSVMVNVKP